MEKFSSIEEWKEKLFEVSKEGNTCILVEGINDFKKLKKYNIIDNVIILKGQKYYDVVEKILNNYDKAIILFDLDKHGEKITEKFIKLLKNEGLEVDLSFRDFLKNINIEEIENLP